MRIAVGVTSIYSLSPKLELHVWLDVKVYTLMFTLNHFLRVWNYFNFTT